MTLTEFLMQRIAEDEAVARHSLDGDLEHLPFLTTKRGDVLYVGVTNPARVLAECEAKRSLVGLLQSDSRDTRNALRREWAVEILRALAAVHADHPDYDPAWEV